MLSICQASIIRKKEFDMPTPTTTVSQYLLAIKINAYEQYLEKTLTIRKHDLTYNGAKTVAYSYIDQTTRQKHKHFSSCKKGAQLEHLFNHRELIKSKLAHYRTLWNSNFIQPCPTIDLEKIRKSRSSFITKELFDSLVPNSNPRPIDRPNPYNGIVFRSKSEREIAEILDEIGIDYKYEPLMRLNDIDMYPDFVCFIPEIGIGFIIEHFGMIDNVNYVETSIRKFRTYTSLGLVPGIDILFTYEKSTVPPTAAYFRSSVNFILDNICAP